MEAQAAEFGRAVQATSGAAEADQLAQKTKEAGDALAQELRDAGLGSAADKAPETQLCML